MSIKSKTFAEYKTEAHTWITLAGGEYYPDILHDACTLYEPVLVMFGKILRSSESSIRVLQEIGQVSEGWMRVQLSRVFRKYISPETPVEMLKRKNQIQEICERFGKNFRAINQAQRAFDSRPIPDEALCALLWEYKDRGKKGYDLTSRFFELFRKHFPDFIIVGPEGAGRDILLETSFKSLDYGLCLRSTNIRKKDAVRRDSRSLTGTISTLNRCVANNLHGNAQGHSRSTAGVWPSAETRAGRSVVVDAAVLA